MASGRRCADFCRVVPVVPAVPADSGRADRGSLVSRDNREGRDNRRRVDLAGQADLLPADFPEAPAVRVQVRARREGFPVGRAEALVGRMDRAAR